MKVKKEYKVGSVSKIIAQNCESTDLDPVLCDIFGSNKYKVTSKKSDITSNISLKKPKKEKIKTEAQNPDGQEEVEVKIKHKTGDGVQGKRKIKKTTTVDLQGRRKIKNATTADLQGKRKIKNTTTADLQGKEKIKNATTVKQGKRKLSDMNDTEEVAQLNIPKKKKKKSSTTKIAEESSDIKIKATGKKKNKKVKNVKKPKQFQSQEENERIIEDFEKEFTKDDDSDDNEDEESSTKKTEKSDAAESKKLANYKLNAPKEKNAEHESRTIFIGNVPTTFAEKHLKRLFGPFGEIEAVRFRGATAEKPHQLKKVAINRKKLNPDQHSLLAYIRFKTREIAEKAVAEMNGHEVQDHHLVVDLADNKAKRDNKKAVFIGNIPLKVQDDEVWKYFQDCGKLKSVRIIRDTFTGLSKGFGYVNFEETDSVPLALKKNGEDFQGRPIRVSKAVKKLKKPKAMSDAQKRNFGRFKKREAENPRTPVEKKPLNNALRRIEQRAEKKKKQALSGEDKFSGDQVAGRQKKFKSKPNRGELHKARIASHLTGVSGTQFKKLNLQKKQSSKKKL